MIEFLLITVPVVFAVAIFFCGPRSLAIRTLLLLCGLCHFSGMTVLNLLPGWNVEFLSAWLGADVPAQVVATVASFLFLCAGAHAFFWLPDARKFESAHGGLMRENVFCAILCIFLATMTLTAFARNFGLLWVAVEATTLASAPLISFHRTPGALEAMWKYLLICSVGIGLALFGTFLLGVAIRNPDGASPGLAFAALGAAGGEFHPEWFKAAFLFCFAGYGLKMGLAPFHLWLPDAHSEAPSMVSVLLSGALLNCSFLGIVRVLEIAPPGLQAFCREYLVGFGVFSLLVAAFFLIRQNDFKRLLAYSSVEHMGLLALLWGLGATEAGLIHLGMHSLCKMILFLVAGNFLLAYGTRRVAEVHGAFARLPRNSTLWLAGTILICGMPPSPLFTTEFLLIKTAGPWLGAVILLLLFAVFCGMTSTAMRMTMGEDIAGTVRPQDNAAEKLTPLPALIMLLVAGIGVYLIFQLAGVMR